MHLLPRPWLVASGLPAPASRDGDGVSREALSPVDDGEEARHALGPHLVLPLARALELDHPVIRRPETEVAAVLSPLQQVPARPRRDVPAHVHHHAYARDSGMVRRTPASVNVTGDQEDKSHS